MTVVHIFPEQTVRFPGGRRRYYVRLVAANGQTLVVSEAYYSKWGAKRAARRSFPGLVIKEVDR